MHSRDREWAELVDALQAPGAGAKWAELRRLVKTHHPDTWRTLRDLRHVAARAVEEVEAEGVEAIERFARRKARVLGRELRQRFSARPPRSRVLWVDLGDLGELVDPRAGGKWQDHGLGLLRTILHRSGVSTDLVSVRAHTSWEEVEPKLAGYDQLVMNVRSYTFPQAVRVARMFKALNPNGLVITGGMHAAVALSEMEEVWEFDKICTGPGEGLIVDLVQNPHRYPRVFPGAGASSMAEWPAIDRTLWPRPAGFWNQVLIDWPLEPDIGWGPSPVVTILTSRVCPWRCSFCNENSFIPNMGRRPVDAVIDELNDLDERYGVGSVVIHDSMFFQNPTWLREWLEKYPRRARKLWPYWAAARADTVRQWPELFEQIVRETNWRTISIGFESGSDNILRILNKECTEEDNDFAIDLVNRIGDDMERAGQVAPTLWTNIMLGNPGETAEDAFKTMRMLKRMKRAIPSLAFYAPYPGSVLGHQLIAEGKSLIGLEERDRGAHLEKVVGVDYQFYRDLLLGKYDELVDAPLTPEERRREHRLLHGGRLSDVLEKS